MDRTDRLARLMAAGALIALTGCGGTVPEPVGQGPASTATASTDEQAERSATSPGHGEAVGAPSASREPAAPAAPLYYAFAFDIDPESPGCGPQARYVKVVGTQFYEVVTFGCDASADRGTIEGDRVALLGRTYVCGSDPPQIESRPVTMDITGGPDDLGIPGETRVVGPTTNLGDLDVWWSEENERVRFPAERTSSAVTEWLSRFAAIDWVGSGC
jgi:hypothetical protein